MSQSTARPSASSHCPYALLVVGNQLAPALRNDDRLTAHAFLVNGFTRLGIEFPTTSEVRYNEKARRAEVALVGSFNNLPYLAASYESFEGSGNPPALALHYGNVEQRRGRTDYVYNTGHLSRIVEEFIGQA